MNLSWSSVTTPSHNCEQCFLPVAHRKNNYVDLFEFSQFNGIPWLLPPGVAPPRRWFADIRYTLSTSLPHRYPSVRKEVLESERVANAVSLLHKENSSLTFYSLNKMVCSYFTEIRGTLSRFVCKICAYLLYKTFRRLMTHLYVSPEQIKSVKEAHDTGIPLVYLPLHRSHLDYLLITWNAWHFGLPLPHIASGDNLNLSGFGWLLRSTGAFFIRRPKGPTDEGGKDVIYRAVLHSYLEQLLKKGLPIEFFSEGTRSRFGKSLLPKHGLISNVVASVQEGTIKDCYLVPVSYTYDQVAEGVFLNELMGVPKVRESVVAVFRGILKAFGLSKRCGAVRMHYGQPVLLSHYLKALPNAFSNTEPSCSLTRLRHSYSYRELIPWHNKHEEKVDNRSLIRAIGYHVVYESQMMNSISPVSILSALILCKYREGTSYENLATDIEWLCSLILQEGIDIMGYKPGITTGNDIIQYAHSYLRESIEIDEHKIKPILTHRQTIHLAYSKNALVPVFALKSAIAIMIVSNPELRITEDSLITNVFEICQWMQFEAIFCRPCQNLETVIKQKIQEMTYDAKLLRKVENSQYISYEITDENSKFILKFLSGFLRPFLQTFYLVCKKLLREPKHNREQEFTRNFCRESLQDLLQQDILPLAEAINSDSIKNTLNALREFEIIKKGLPIYVADSDRLQNLVDASYEILKI